MITSSEYIKQSLALHLFFARIMKEHAFFLQIAFTPRDSNYSNQANALRLDFDKLLMNTISLSKGLVNPMVLQSGEVITPYTLEAEKASSFYTGVNLQTSITEAEYDLKGGGVIESNPKLEQDVNALNNRAIGLTNSIIQFKTTILNEVLSCKMFTTNYPSLIEHVIDEAKHYLEAVQKLQRKEEIHKINEAPHVEEFWNEKMADHAKTIRGLLDPTEKDLMSTANNFANQFDQLTNEAKKAMDRAISTIKVTNESLKATESIRNFKAQATRGLLEYNIKSIIMPLLADHVLRETNHYLHMLKMFQAGA